MPKDQPLIKLWESDASTEWNYQISIVPPGKTSRIIVKEGSEKSLSLAMTVCQQYNNKRMLDNLMQKREGSDS